MSDAMTQLYQQVILDHARERHGYGLIAGGDGESFQVNPTCGDEIRLRVHLDNDSSASAGSADCDSGDDPATTALGPRIQAISWEGTGCSISQASASILTDLLQGASVREADEMAQLFRALMDNRGRPVEPEVARRLGDAAAFHGVARFPARIKCALLGWMTLRDALAHALTSPPSQTNGNNHV